jgi:hypothetical protein
MPRDHDADVKKFQAEAKSGKDADLKAWATKTLPVLQEHERRAHQLTASAGAGRRAPSSEGSASTLDSIVRLHIQIVRLPGVGLPRRPGNLGGLVDPPSTMCSCAFMGCPCSTIQCLPSRPWTARHGVGSHAEPPTM